MPEQHGTVWVPLQEREVTASEAEWLRALRTAAPNIEVDRMAQVAWVGSLHWQWQVVSPLQLGALSLPRLRVTVFAAQEAFAAAQQLLATLDARMRRGGG